jgi:hypothetical protein
MDEQVIFNWIVGVAGVLGGWTLKVIWDSLMELRRDIKTMDTKMHDDFVRRDDFKDAVRELKEDMRAGFSTVDATLRLLFKKLDDKENR